MLQVGAGGNVLDGWLNTDYQRHPKCVFLDITRPLPFETSTLDLILSEHVISTLPKESVSRFFQEACRCLRPGGILRVSIPNLTGMCRLLCQPELGPERERIVRRHQQLFRAGEAISYCDVFNDVMHLWNHQYIYSEDELDAQLRQAGFTEIRRANCGESIEPRLCKVECRPDPEAFSPLNLIVEAVR